MGASLRSSQHQEMWFADTLVLALVIALILHRFSVDNMRYTALGVSESDVWLCAELSASSTKHVKSERCPRVTI